VVHRLHGDRARESAPHPALTLVTNQDKPRAPTLNFEHELMGGVVDEDIEVDVLRIDGRVRRYALCETWLALSSVCPTAQIRHSRGREKGPTTL
jgi:hypothetical protein